MATCSSRSLTPGLEGQDGELGQGPYALPAIYSTQSLSTSASGFLFLSNKKKITICNWAGGVWEGGSLSTGDDDGGLSGERLGKERQLGAEEGLRLGSGQCQGVKNLAVGSAFVEDQLGLSFLSTKASHQEAADSSPISLFGRRQTGVNLSRVYPPRENFCTQMYYLHPLAILALKHTCCYRSYLLHVITSEPVLYLVSISTLIFNIIRNL